MSKSDNTTSSFSLPVSDLKSLSRPGLRQLRSSNAASAFSGVRTKATLAPSSTVIRKTKVLPDGHTKGSCTSKTEEQSTQNEKKGNMDNIYSFQYVLIGHNK